jgi:hypothetical protein
VAARVRRRQGQRVHRRARYDDSMSRNLAQISVPVIDNGRATGVITVGVAP